MVVDDERDVAAERLTVGSAERVLLTDDDGDCVSDCRGDLVVEELVVIVGDAEPDLDACVETVRELDAVDERDMRLLSVPVDDALILAVDDGERLNELENDFMTEADAVEHGGLESEADDVDVTVFEITVVGVVIGERDDDVVIVGLVHIEAEALLVFAKEGDTLADGLDVPVRRAFVFVGADVGEWVFDIFGDSDGRMEHVLVGVPVGVLDCSGDFVAVRLTVVDPVVVVVALTVFDMDTVRDAVVDPDAVFVSVVLSDAVDDTCADFETRLLRVCDGEPDAVCVGGDERVCDGSAVVVFDRMAVNEFVGLPLTVLLVDGEAVVVLLIVLVRVEEGDPVCVAVSLGDHENAGDEEGLFDAVVVRVDVGESHAV